MPATTMTHSYPEFHTPRLYFQIMFPKLQHVETVFQVDAFECRFQ